MSADVPGRWKRRLLALGLALLGALVAGEIAVRICVGAPMAERLPILMMRANPVRGWEMVPGLEHYTYQHRVRVNALGLRGAEVGEKRPGEVRVLALGDSLIYGQGVGDDETVPAALEAELVRRAPERPWSVVNSGHRSYDTAQELALLEELGPRIQPDVVLLCWYWNDVNERNIARTYENLKTRGELAFDTGDRLEGAQRLRWQAKQLVRRSALFMWAHDVLGSKGEPFEPAYFEKGLERLEHYLDRLRALGAERGFVPVFVVVPDANVLAGRRETQPFAERAAALARERGLEVVELQPALEPLVAGSGRLPILPYDGHYDAEANRAMGRWLAERVLALDLPARAQ